MTRPTLALAALAAGVLACDPKPAPPPVTPEPVATAPEAPPPSPTASEEPVEKIDDARGGRLYDRWWALEPYRSTFLPDDRDTKELDGKGGPNGNGTLNDEHGQAILNDGHEYRLKNFFGWDLRGAEGIYGPKYQNKEYVRPENLLAKTDWDFPTLVDRLRRGGDGLPAYGDVLSEEDLENLAYFVLRMREGVLARPDQIFVLDDKAPKSYRLREGGDAERGKRHYADTCAKCHGPEGKKKIFENGKHSLGSHVRTSAYEDWLKILNGQPGTAMGRQLPPRHSGADQARMILDLFAALCDRKAFPAVVPAEDAPEGDPRCGPYR